MVSLRRLASNSGVVAALSARRAGSTLGVVPVCASCGRESEGDFAFCPYCGAALVAAPSTAREQRKIVTVVFCDVAGSTSLGESVDPEALRSILHRYFERIKAIVEGHGGRSRSSSATR